MSRPRNLLQRARRRAARKRLCPRKGPRGVDASVFRHWSATGDADIQGKKAASDSEEEKPTKVSVADDRGNEADSQPASKKRAKKADPDEEDDKDGSEEDVKVSWRATCLVAAKVQADLEARQKGQGCPGQPQPG